MNLEAEEETDDWEWPQYFFFSNDDRSSGNNLLYKRIHYILLFSEGRKSKDTSSKERSEAVLGEWVA